MGSAIQPAWIVDAVLIGQLHCDEHTTVTVTRQVSSSRRTLVAAAVRAVLP